MRISELSSQTGIPIATIKFYLRENLLQEGRRTAATQAQYDDGHVARLRLIRALLGPGGLSVSATRQVIRAIEEPPESLHELLGVAATALPRPDLDEALRGIKEAGFELPEGALDVYRDHLRQIAEFEIENVPHRLRYCSSAVCSARHGTDRAAYPGPSSRGRAGGFGPPLRLTVALSRLSEISSYAAMPAP
jgi:DNA-binding transcriptional MerR regulator